MDISIHSTFLPHNDPEESLAFYRDTLGFEGAQRRWLTPGCAGSRSAHRPARDVDRAVTRRSPPRASPTMSVAPSRKMMAKARTPSSSWPRPTSTAPSSGWRPVEPRFSRSRPSSRTDSALRHPRPAGNLIRISELRLRPNGLRSITWLTRPSSSGVCDGSATGVGTAIESALRTAARGSTTLFGARWIALGSIASRTSVLDRNSTTFQLRPRGAPRARDRSAPEAAGPTCK